MTCIVGYTDEESNVFIGGDSAASSNTDDMRIRVDQKVCKKSNGMIFGFTSSFRMGQIIQYCFDVPKKRCGQDDFEYLCGDFVNSLIRCLKDNGYAEIQDNVVTGGIFLLGFNGNLYKIQKDFQVSQIVKNYNACGCGEQYAMGAMRIMEGQDLSPGARIKTALDTAEVFSCAVSSPYHIVSTEGQKENNDG